MRRFLHKILNYTDIILFLIIVTIKVLMYGKQIGDLYFTFKQIFIPVFSSVLVIGSISVLFKAKTRSRFLYMFNILITIMVVADLVYYRYYRDILSIPVMRNAFLLGDVKSSVSSLFKITDFLYFIDIPFIRPSLFYKRFKFSDDKILTKIISFIILFSIGVSADYYNIHKLSVDQPRLITTMFNRIYVVRVLGNINFHFLDIGNFAVSAVSKSKPVSAQKQAEIKAFLSKKNAANPSAALKGSEKNNNLIIIQVEALQQFTINAKVNGQEITPNLNKWVKRSTYFDNYFYQVADGNTADAEFMTNNSLYPASEGAACYLYSSNTYNSLAKVLNSKGYDTAVMHGYKESFWNRNVMNKAEGYQNFYGEKTYNINETVGMGLSDKSFFNQSVEKIKSLKQPYYSFLITLSSHYPFDDTSHYGNFNISGYENTLLGNYLQAIHYTDAQIGMFLDKLDKEGITKNATIVIYGDHYAIPKKEEAGLDKLLDIKNPTDLTWMQLQKVPMIIHFPDESQKGVNHLYSCEMDLLPTIANLYGISSPYLFGKDMFNSKEGDVIFRDGSFTDGSIFYLSPSNTYYDIKSGEEINETSKLSDKKANAAIQLEYSDDILNHNLIKKFESKK